MERQDLGSRKRFTINATESKKLFPRQPNIRTNGQWLFLANGKFLGRLLLPF